MAEYIDKDKLENYAMGCVGGSVTIRQIHQFPAEDVAPVVHGEWNERQGFYEVGYKCSVCSGYSIKKTNFCEHCGTDMRIKDWNDD